jgi:hypothetical protein
MPPYRMSVKKCLIIWQRENIVYRLCTIYIYIHSSLQYAVYSILTVDSA